MLTLLAEASSQGQLVGAVSILSGVIAFLWRHSVAKTEETEKRLKKALEKCEIGHRETAAKREEDQVVMRDLTGMVGKHEGMFLGYEQAREDVRNSLNELSTHVLNQLNKEVPDAASDGSSLTSTNVPDNLVGGSGPEALVNPGI